ncbi:MAG: hypothetical protein JSU88_00585 [Nitrospinaceae bacterium]|jgi:hypothetical protein|nr:MAG: hypothetical protein JSU88_00585 [Nitrospinaceae bacterium]
MSEKAVTVAEVRQAQEEFKTGDAHYRDKEFKEAIAAFRKTVEAHPYEEGHLDELQKKLRAGNFKLQQECIAYMGCAAVHLSRMISELTEDQRDQVPVDESLLDAFKGWN